MKILAIESSSLVASAAIIEDDRLIAEYTVNNKITHSETLLPMINEIMSMTDTDKASITAVAVSGGPGSYTGLRIGSATAKGLGMAWSVPLVHVPTLDAMAYNAYGYEGLVCPIMDARRGQVYSGVYSFSKGFEALLPGMATTADELAGYLKANASGKKVLLIGDGIPVHAEKIKTELEEIADVEIAPPMMNRQRAASVAWLGELYYMQGRTENAGEHLPDYMRMAQAERERKDGKDDNQKND